MKAVPLFCTEPTRYPLAQQLVERFALPLVCSAPTQGYWLELGAERLSLESQGKQGSVYAEFVQGVARYRREQGGGRGQLVARAVGLKSGRKAPYVVDATAGLGRDAFVLASLGCRVTLLERSPIAAALLADALARAAAHHDTRDIVARMQLVHVDAIHWLRRLQQEDYPEVIVVDPMFPEKSKQAAVKKEMSTFQHLIGDDHDAAALLAMAIEVATTRVVVKRPRQGAAIAGVTPSATLIGKSTRFDLYSIKAIHTASCFAG
jgi:16S rRNA (guanine1516-N2)-methyltransferase